jgi:hypothetical protein
MADDLTDPVKVANVIRLILAVKNARSYFGGVSSLTFAKVPALNLGVGFADYVYYGLLQFPTLVI